MTLSLRNVAAILTIGLAATLTGCGDSSTPDQKADTTAPAETLTETAEAPAAETESPAEADTATADAAPSLTLTQEWELAGLSTPESALVDASTGLLFVSNVAGGPMDKDGNGFISKVTKDGKIDTLEWVKGLNAPKGLALTGGKLYVADIDELVEIDVAKGEVSNRYAAADAKFLNDVAADNQGRVYVSDMLTNAIWRLDGATFEKWIDDPALLSPNGLLVEGDRLLVAAWGVMTDGFATAVPGHMLQVSLSDKTIKPLGDTTPVGNLDGLEPDGAGGYLVSDWMAGKLFRFDANGKAELLLSELGQGSADIGFDPATRTVYIPLMNQDKLRAYSIK
jgi:sugar lactone lactonase YvrE